MEVIVGLIAYISFFLLSYNLFIRINKKLNKIISLVIVLVLPIISLIFSSLLIKFLEISPNLKGYTEDYYIWMITITIVAYSFLFAKNYVSDLYVSKPIKRHWGYYVAKKPYTTLYESFTTPPWGRRIPSRYEILKWREKYKDFAPGISQWIVLLITILICIFELTVFSIIFSLIYTGHFNLSNIHLLGITALELLKFIGSLIFIFFIFLFILNRVVFFINDFLHVIIEHILNKSLEEYEWSKLLSFTLLFNILVVLIIVILVKLIR
ncbi:hypothetical protein [Oceanirhabdus sp. W0125-5]|uniref:hypothetical protein n=1 Tax=Oceanirhabdus sp. W0125-5 TaxID=2999116 RepID=UPI0022F2B031|nr:hypothetical protein [Oceanirhabdus sp. W0125-5]WBW97288.1 hypothetical protein OW730_00090 [Oceanirhabdus sp. W0125-5]